MSKDDKFYCCICIDKLIAFQRSTREDCSIHNILNFLHSLNLEGINIREREEIDLMNIIISRALEENID